MKFIEDFKYWLINRPMFEMAFYRKDAIDSIRSLSDTILIHILKVKCLQSDKDENHWKKEINTFFRKVNSIRIKPKNKKFSQEEYMNFLFIEPYCMSNSSYKNSTYYLNEPYLKSIIREINYEYNSSIKYSDININELIDFFKEISNKIEKDEDFFKIIEELK